MNFLNAQDIIQELPQLYGGFKAYVVDNNDPKKLGRIKCKVHRKLETASISDLPWCFPKGYACLGGRPDCSNFTVPEIDTEVKITFPYGIPYVPEYEAIWQNTNTHQGEVFDEDYPESYGHINSEVSWLRVNKKQNYTEGMHVSETLVRVDKEGNVWFHNPKNVTIDVGKNLEINVVDHMTIKTGKTLNFDVGENMNERIAGNRACKTTKSTEFETGESFGATATSMIAMKGKISYEQTQTVGITSQGMGELEEHVTELDANVTTLRALKDTYVSIQQAVKSHAESVKSIFKGIYNALVGDK